MPDPGWIASGRYAVRAQGSFHTLEYGQPVPLVHARVEIMDSDSATDTLTDDLMGVGLTDGAGNYVIDGRGDDDGSLTPRPDVYARVVLDDCGRNPVRCTNELNSARWGATPQHDHDNVTGEVNLGAWIWGNQNSSSAPSVWRSARQSFIDYQNRDDPGRVPPAGQYDIEYWSAIYAGTPWTNRDTTHWPRHYPTGLVNDHEFAHTIRHTLDGDQNHFNWDVTRFTYARNHALSDKTNEGFAFNEGWAEFWAGTLKLPTDGIDPEVEGEVAWELAQLANLSLRAGHTVGKAGLVRVLESNPGEIHNITEFETLFDREFPGLRVGEWRTPIVVAGLRPAYRVPWSNMQSWAEAEIAAHREAAAALTRAVRQAVAEAVDIPTLPVDSNCFGFYVKLGKPHRLRTVIALHHLAIKQITGQLEFRDSIASRFEDGTFDEWYVGWKADYLRQIWEIGLRGLRDTLRAVTPLDVSENGRLLVRRFRAKLDGWEADVASGEPPPLGWQPQVLSDEPMSRTEAQWRSPAGRAV